ncbi:MAG: YdcF family protein [Propionicimonas sp.]
MRPVSRALVTTGVVAGLGVAGVSVAVQLIARDRIADIDAVPSTPVGLVLGAQVLPDLVPSVYLQARLDVAAQLYARGLVERLLVSGDGRSRFYDETTTMATYLIRRGVPADRIDIDPLGLDTFASCQRARDEFGVQRLTVITQRYHLPRALAACAALGIDAWGVPDTTVTRLSRRWLHGWTRELAANLKLVADIVRQRQLSQS